MKTKIRLSQARLFCAVALGIASSISLVPQCGTAEPAENAPAKSSIPWSQLGAKAGADYQGDGLAVSPTAGGARLRCVFQRLEGEATREGLWLTSTLTDAVNDRFRVVAADVRRLTSARNPKPETQNEVQSLLTSAATDQGTLPRTGTVQVAEKLVRFTRPGLVEEYSVSRDGVRQDFVVLERPAGAGELAVPLAVSGARVEPAVGGAQLVLEGSGRKIAYSRLRVTDATGKELTARIDVASDSDVAASRQSAADVEDQDGGALPSRRYARLVVLVNDADAVYPVRIDPTFSDANWISMGGFPGANGSVRAAAADGSGNLYICGDFTCVGNTPANHIAKWNGSTWTNLGSGVDGTVFALAVSGTDLYAAGSFRSAGGSAANYIAKWNGSSWSALGSGLGGDYPSAYALAVSGSNVYAGGSFATVGGVAATNIAKWDGTSWSALGSGIGVDDPYWGIYSPVYALAVSGSSLFAGGYFTMASGSPANCIAKWDGTSWSALGSGVSGSVQALAASGSDLYAGGDFTMAGANPANYIAKWDGTSWSALGSGMSGAVSSLAVSGSGLYAGGSFTNAGSIAATNIAKWNGNTWAEAGSGVNSTVSALAVSGNDLYAGGGFTSAGGNPANYIAKWDGNSWTLPTSGISAMNGAVQALAVSGSDVYAGGYFTKAGGIVANAIARWDGASWSPLGSGMSGGEGHMFSGPLPPYVAALAIFGGSVYAGGYFTNAGGIAANYIAKWDGGGWSPLGSGIEGGVPIFGDFYPPYVSALAVSGSNLYTGGWFRTAGGNPANNIAKWNGNSWSALGSGIGSGVFGDFSKVYAVAVSGNDLYAGGNFTTAGGNPANYIAKWDGGSWSALGLGMNNSVNALAVSGSNLYAGGQFTTAGGIAATNIAKWDGSSWSAVGSGMNGGYNPIVYALAVSGSNNVYAGGSFTNADGSPANYIAKWDGTTWTMLGSGLNNNAYALAISGSDLYVGGAFTTAGGKTSAYLARAIVNPPVLAIEGDGFGGYFLSFEGVPGSPYRLQRAPALSGPWATSSPQTAPASGWLEFWDVFPTPGQGFYRSVGP